MSTITPATDLVKAEPTPRSGFLGESLPVGAQPDIAPIPLSRARVDAAPWQFDPSQYQIAHGVHQPHICEISPMQFAHLSKRSKVQYEAQRAVEWQRSADIKTEWAVKVVEAWKAGRFDPKDPGVHREARCLVWEAQAGEVKARKAAKRQVVEQRLAIRSTQDVKPGDRVWTPLYGPGTAVKINRASLQLQQDSRPEGTIRVPFTWEDGTVTVCRRGNPDRVRELVTRVRSGEPSLPTPVEASPIKPKRVRKPRPTPSPIETREVEGRTYGRFEDGTVKVWVEKLNPGSTPSAFWKTTAKAIDWTPATGTTEETPVAGASERWTPSRMEQAKTLRRERASALTSVSVAKMFVFGDLAGAIEGIDKEIKQAERRAKRELKNPSPPSMMHTCCDYIAPDRRPYVLRQARLILDRELRHSLPPITGGSPVAELLEPPSEFSEIDATTPIGFSESTLTVKGRAYHVTPYPMGDSDLRSYRIESGESDYDLNEIAGGRAVCSCMDFQVRHAESQGRTVCKHIEAGERAGLVRDLRVSSPVMSEPDQVEQTDPWTAAWVLFMIERRASTPAPSFWEVVAAIPNYSEFPNSSLATPEPYPVESIDTVSLPIEEIDSHAEANSRRDIELSRIQEGNEPESGPTWTTLSWVRRSPLSEHRTERSPRRGTDVRLHGRQYHNPIRRSPETTGQRDRRGKRPRTPLPSRVTIPAVETSIPAHRNAPFGLLHALHANFIVDWAREVTSKHRSREISRNHYLASYQAIAERMAILSPETVLPPPIAPPDLPPPRRRRIMERLASRCRHPFRV